jgi:hypothetical protein
MSGLSLESQADSSPVSGKMEQKPSALFYSFQVKSYRQSEMISLNLL